MPERNGKKLTYGQLLFQALWNFISEELV
jgi:hypothetical protein